MSIRYFFSLLLLSLLSSCGPAQQLAEDIQDYQQRLANVLEQNQAPFSSPVLPPYPALQQLSHPTSDTTIKLSDFYQLQDCQVATLVAERNTVLGKLQLPSKRFSYEKKLIQLLKQCIEQTQNQTLQAKIKPWLKQKQQDLSGTWADLIQKSTETKQAFSANLGYVAGDLQDGLSETTAALDFLLTSEQQDNLDSSILENHLQHLANTALPAKLWLSQQLLTENLNSTSQWLKHHKPEALCQGKPTAKNATQIGYLVNVFQLFFIEKIQAVASQINYYHYQLEPIMTALQQHPALSPAFKHYITVQQQQSYAAYQQAMQTHIAYWQDLFKQCNLQPGKNRH